MGCVISIKAEIVVPILVWAEICLDCVPSALWSVCVLLIHLHMCVHACVPRCSWSFMRMLSPIPDVFFLWRELVGWNTWYFCDPLSILPWRGGVIYLISNFGKTTGPNWLVNPFLFWELSCPLKTWVLRPVSPRGQNPSTVLSGVRGAGLPNTGLNFNKSIFLKGLMSCPPVGLHWPLSSNWR